jgi:hypothetical protein
MEGSLLSPDQVPHDQGAQAAGVLAVVELDQVAALVDGGDQVGLELRERGRLSRRQAQDLPPPAEELFGPRDRSDRQ